MKITLKAARVNAKFTQKQAAKELGVSNSTLCKWEKGITLPNIEMVMKICDLYKVKLDDLIFLPDSTL